MLRGRPVLFVEGLQRVGIARVRTGAPAAAIDLEYAIAWGVRRFIVVGTAGSLQASLAIGELVVCDRAIRDEGTSRHYAEPGRYAFPSRQLTGGLVEALERRGSPHRCGTTWTTDAPFRETRTDVRGYRAEGVAVVDMEAAALFSVARYREVEIAAAFVVSDSLAADSWQPGFHREATVRGVQGLVDAACRVLAADGGRS
jgi:uridine phosphorylase